MFLKIISFLIVLTFSFATKIPNTLQKCDRKNKNLNNCLTKALNDVFSKSTSEFREINLATLDPLKVPALDLGAGSSAVHFDQHFKNMSVLGLSNLKCAKVEMDFDAKTFYLDCTSPLVTLKFNYEFNGQLLVLPITGSGPGVFSLENLLFQQTFNLKGYNKKGKQFFKVESNKLNMVPTKIIFRFDNLFNGDKTLGDNINQVFNENWADVYADLKPIYEEAFGSIFQSVFNQVLQKVSVEELFGKA